MTDKRKEVIKRLKEYQKWRRGDEELSQPEPKQLGEDIDFAIESLQEPDYKTNALSNAGFTDEQISALNEWMDART